MNCKLVFVISWSSTVCDVHHFIDISIPLWFSCESIIPSLSPVAIISEKIGYKCPEKIISDERLSYNDNGEMWNWTREFDFKPVVKRWWDPTNTWLLRNAPLVLLYLRFCSFIVQGINYSANNIALNLSKLGRWDIKVISEVFLWKPRQWLRQGGWRRLPPHQPQIGQIRYFFTFHILGNYFLTFSNTCCFFKPLLSSTSNWSNQAEGHFIGGTPID